MSRRLLEALGVLFFLATSPASATAQIRPRPTPTPPRDGIPEFPVVSPTLHMLERLADDGVADPPFSSIDGASRVDVLIRHRCPPQTVDRVPFLQSHETLNGITAASVGWKRLDTMARLPCLVRVEPARLPGNLAALEETTASTGAHAVHYRPDSQFNGQNTTIALLDSPIDILHPAFFRPDGGRYRWLDLDEDGLLTPGIDAVDLDGDREADNNETLRVLDATTAVDMHSSIRSNADDVFQAGRDWLYMDMNGDGRRNAGHWAGFHEYDPAYAEPTFVADDVDRDGRLERGERLYRLDTSKIKRIVRAETTYVRGDNLIEAVGKKPPGRALHGTGVAGILVGGQLGFHQRVGVAPRADLVVVGYPHTVEDEQTRHLQGLRTALDQNADVFLTEWTNPFVRPLDGSTNLEAAMSDAREEGLAQVVPVGNLNLSEKHLERRLTPGKPSDLRFDVPRQITFRNQTAPVRYVFGSLQWQADTPVDLQIALPDGDPRSIPADGTPLSLVGADLQVARDRTPGGTRIVRFYLRVRESTERLPAGTWRFVAEASEAPATIYGRITDERTGWSRGVGWVDPTSDDSTISFPATADAALGVAAYAGRAPTGSQTIGVGELRRFSGRGPRIDGARVVDIAAPDNPFVPVAATSRARQAGWARGWYHMFGGTSGAAPHVAGALALLAEARPDAGLRAREQTLLEHTARTGLSPAPDVLPDPGWGHGKLRLHRALFGTPPPTNTAPKARLAVEQRNSRLYVDATDSFDPDGDPIAYRFDLDHDGDWDTDWQTNGVVNRRLDELFDPRRRRHHTRLEVRDSHGARAGALASLDMTLDDPSTDDAGLEDAGLDGADDQPPTRDADGGPLAGCSFLPSQSPPERIPPVLGLLVGMCLVRLRR